MISGICFKIIYQRGAGCENEGRDEISMAMSQNLLQLEHGYTGVYYINFSLFCICVVKNSQENTSNNRKNFSFEWLNYWIFNFSSYSFYFTSFCTIRDHK